LRSGDPVIGRSGDRVIEKSDHRGIGSSKIKPRLKEKKTRGPQSQRIAGRDLKTNSREWKKHLDLVRG